VVHGVEADGGKGQAMAAALAASSGDVVVFLDADVANTTPAFVTGMLGPLLFTDDIALVKGFYTRPLHGDPTGRRRVTELVARPCSNCSSPSSPRSASPWPARRRRHRWVFEKVGFADGYGVELALLIDVASSSAPASWPRSTWASASTATGPCTSCAPRPPTCCGPRWTAPPDLTAGERRIVVSNRGPALLPLRRRRQNLQPSAGGGGLVSSMRPLLAGAGATWVSVTMGAADRAAVAAGRMVDDRLTLLPVTDRRRHLPRPTTSSPTPPCGTATTISSTCPAGPASTATGGWPGRATALQPGHGRP
jgi:hypothetical protein